MRPAPTLHPSMQLASNEAHSLPCLPLVTLTRPFLRRAGPSLSPCLSHAHQPLALVRLSLMPAGPSLSLSHLSLAPTRPSLSLCPTPASPSRAPAGPSLSRALVPLHVHQSIPCTPVPLSHPLVLSLLSLPLLPTSPSPSRTCLSLSHARQSLSRACRSFPLSHALHAHQSIPRTPVPLSHPLVPLSRLLVPSLLSLPLPPAGPSLLRTGLSMSHARQSLSLAQWSLSPAPPSLSRAGPSLSCAPPSLSRPVVPLSRASLVPTRPSPSRLPVSLSCARLPLARSLSLGWRVDHRYTGPVTRTCTRRD